MTAITTGYPLGNTSVGSGSNIRQLQLPLRRGTGNECRLIFENGGRRLAEADGPNEAILIVDAINTSATNTRITDEQKRLIILTRDREWSNRIQSQDTIHPDSPNFNLAVAWYVRNYI